MGLRHLATVLLGATVSAAAQTPTPAFAFAAPPLSGAFANLLGDRLALQRTGDALTADGSLDGQNVQLRGTAGGAGFTGDLTRAAAAASPCTGTLTGECLVLRSGTAEWRLWPELPLDPTLADLGTPDIDANRAWTIAVYLDGDNSLEADALRDLLEMQAGMPASGCEVVALVDRRSDPDDGPDDWSDTRVLRIRPGSDGLFDTLGPTVERDLADPATLASFVTGVFRKFPAPHHAVFLWDHGRGWAGICNDDGGVPDAELHLAGVRDGLRTALQASGMLKLDLVAFDACLMAQLDVALAVHDLADTMLASEAIVPGTGYPYTKVLPLFAGGRSARAIVQTIVGEYGQFSDDAFDSGSTLAAFDLAKAPAVAAAVDALAGQALAACDTQWQAIARALFFAECYQARAERIDDEAAASCDLLDLAARLRGVPGIDDPAIAAVNDAVAALLLGRYSGAERTLSHGLAIYAPHRSGQFHAEYLATPLGRGSRWPQLLQRVHELADRDQSPITLGDFRQLDALGNAATSAHPFGGDRVLFTATGNALVEVQARTWERDEGSNQWLMLRAELVTDPLWPARWATAAAADLVDLVMPQFTDGRNELFFELGGFEFAITDGTLLTHGSLDLATPSMQAPIMAIARFTAKATGATMLVQCSFDRIEWRLVGLQPIVPPGATVVPRAPVPAIGDTFEFWLMTHGDDGSDGGVFTPPLTWSAQGLHLQAEPDTPGTHRLELVARGMQGRTATASHDYEVEANPDLQAWADSWQGFDPATLVGTWQQFKVTGPQQYQDLRTTCEVTATDASNLFTVLAKGGPEGDEYELHPLWFFEWRGLPCLRVVTQIADGQKYGWYGPARIGEKDGKPFLAMKALNASGVVWEWRKL